MSLGETSHSLASQKITTGISWEGMCAKGPARFGKCIFWLFIGGAESRVWPEAVVAGAD